MKKIIALLMISIFCLTACGNSVQVNNTEKASGSVQADASFYSKADLSNLSGKKVGITIQTLDNAYWAGVMSALEELLIKYEVDYSLVACDQNSDTQIGQIENFIDKKYDLIVVHAANADAVEDICKNAMDKGIKVMCWDDPMINTDADWVLDNQALGNEIGRLAGEFISAHYDNENKAQVAIIEYNDVAILLDRAEGIKAGLEESAAGKYTIVAEEPGLDPKGAQASMERILASNPECKIAVGIGSGAMIGANEAFMNYYDSVIPSEVGVITTDVTKRQLNAIVSDEACRGIIGFEGSDEDTAEAAMAMFSLLIDNNVGAHEVYRNVAPITTENCASILEEMK